MKPAKGTMPERTLDTMSMAIEMSSPSGRVSKRAKQAAEKRLRVALFGEGNDLKGIAPEPTVEEKCARKIAWAKYLRGLASRGMGVRKFIKEAERLEKEAAEDRLIASGAESIGSKGIGK